MTTTTTSILHAGILESPVGPLTLVATEAALRMVLWPDESPGSLGLDDAMAAGPNDVVDAARAQLEEYFARTRRTFDIPLEPIGTDFQCAVWLALASIPYGTTSSYAEHAARVGRPKAARAVGAANARNPLSIILPCHRVIGADGSLTGFAAGLDAKRFLLALEQS